MRSVTVGVFVLACVLAVAGSSLAHDRDLPGRSHHGAAFDRGPRWSAYLMGGTGNVRFPVTSKNPLVQKFIEQGIGQLHGFWYVEAERSFREAAALDPNCGIAYWGMSLANELHPTRAEQFAKEAAAHKDGLTEREKLYIDALTSPHGYTPLFQKYPNDLEAKAFEVWRIWNAAEHSNSGNYLGDGIEIAREILRVNPMHPIHHAIIHITDATNTISGALESAARCGETAPSIGHLWHMPTHIYFPMRRYPEAEWQLEASIRTEQARMMHDRVLPDQVHLYAHNNEWLVRTMLHLGRVHDARSVAEHMIDLPRHPLLNVIEPPENSGPEADEDSAHDEKLVEVHGTSAYYGRERLLQVLRQYEYWDDLVEACKSGYVEPTGLIAEQGRVHLNLGVGEYCRGNVAEGNKELVDLRKLLEKEAEQQLVAIAEAQRAPDHERARAIADVNKKFTSPLLQLQASILELESYQNIATGFFVSRTNLLVYLALIVVGDVVLFWFLRRRLLLAILSVVVAIAAGVWLFQRHLALWDLPYDSKNVEFAYMSRKQLEAGDPDVAEWCARGYASERKNQVRPLANLVEILYRIGKKGEARAEFEQLRELAGSADLDSPPLARLAPIAREFGFPTDWRLPEAIEKSLAGRRSLKTLGPLLWRPWTAPDWKLADSQGREHTLAEFRGKPVLLIFFLGRGCLHCEQQLQAFAKKAQDFKDAGITVVAVSTDDQAGIKKFTGQTPFPFLMLADPDKTVFQSYRTYDTFEQIALHGTFLIDPQGFCRWHDVSFEPFMDVGFVLGESKRLLSRPIAPVEPGVRVIADNEGTQFPGPTAAAKPVSAAGIVDARRRSAK